MSQAFVKEEEGEWLHDITGTLPALINYLTRENNGIRIYLKRQYINDKKVEVFEMSNGLQYSKDQTNHWQIVN